MLSVVPIGSSKRQVRRASSTSNRDKSRQVEDEIVIVEEDDELDIRTRLPRSVGDGVIVAGGRILAENSLRRDSVRGSIRAMERSQNGEESNVHGSALDPFYEAWVLINTKNSTRTKTIQVFGIKVKIKEPTSSDPARDYYSGIAATQDEIKNLVAQIRADPKQRNQKSSTLEQLTSLSSEAAITASHLMSIRTMAMQYGHPSRTWAIELLTPWSAIPGSPSQIARRVHSTLDPGYLIVLRSQGDERVLTVPELHVNPFQEGPILVAIDEKKHHHHYHHKDSEFALVRGRPSSRPGPREREIARRVARNEDEDVKLSQKETETAVNDFLASFSALYDDVPPGERYKVSDSVPLVEEEEEEDSDVDTSESESGRRSSLIDD